MREEDFQEILRVQQMMSQRIMQEQRVDRKIEVLNIINDLTTGGKRTQVEAILIESKVNGIPEDEALNLLGELEKDNLIVRSAGGYVQRA